MNKLAKLKYLPNNFDIMKKVIMLFAQFRKEDPLQDLNYWSVDDQEAYFSYVEASVKKKII